ncbi:MAG: cation diffusion facilitator family transporter [Actinomycetia bacterium]|jgi:cobalt-zinc-cadmium efflux system protein|nr:cation diffusion facilitator family transporter [Actinomycetes bacterium]
MHVHSHGSGHAHDHSRVKDRRAIAIALGLIVTFMGVEVAAGVAAGSLALLADAGHMLTDAAALGAALVASRLASRPARGQWTFGFGRAEILAAQANGLALLLLGIWIVYSAGRRLAHPPAVHGGIVLVVALVGVAVNLAATLVLARADRSSLNVQGAFVHIATDLAAFAGTAVAGALVLLTGWSRFDPIAGLLVAALMVRSSWSLIRESGRIFLEASPAGIDPDDVARALVADPDVAEVHDLHIWTVTSGFPALAAHVLVAPGADCHDARRRLDRLLEERFHLHHTTLQVDHLARRSQDVALDLGDRR